MRLAELLQMIEHVSRKCYHALVVLTCGLMKEGQTDLWVTGWQGGGTLGLSKYMYPG